MKYNGRADVSRQNYLAVCEVGEAKPVVVIYEMMIVRFNEGDRIGAFQGRFMNRFAFCYLRRPLANHQSGVIKVVDLKEDHGP